MGTEVEFRVLELLASRICHDLVSPVGAIGNGLELIEEAESDLDREALQLCLNSQRRAAALLQSFRAAFGVGHSSDRLESVRSLATEFLEGGKVRLDWPSALPATEPRPGVSRLLLNLVLLGSECLPRGGTVRVEAGAAEAAVQLTGPDVRLSDELRGALDGTAAAAALTPRTVQGFLTRQIAAGLGGELAVQTGAGGLRIGCRFRG